MAAAAPAVAPAPEYAYSSLQFCECCDSAYAVRTHDGALQLFCRCCGNTAPTNRIVVHRQAYNAAAQDRLHSVNKYTRFDRTLPVTNTVACPTCGGSQAKFFKASDSQMALMYVCVAPGCCTTWRK